MLNWRSIQRYNLEQFRQIILWYTFYSINVQNIHESPQKVAIEVQQFTIWISLKIISENHQQFELKTSGLLVSWYFRNRILILTHSLFARAMFVKHSVCLFVFLTHTACIRTHMWLSFPFGLVCVWTFSIKMSKPKDKIKRKWILYSFLRNPTKKLRLHTIFIFVYFTRFCNWFVNLYLFPFCISQRDIDEYFPANYEDLILYAPNTTTTYNIMENVRRRLNILEES